MSRINNWLLRWILLRILGSDSWITPNLNYVMKAVYEQLERQFYEDNHDTRIYSMKEAVDAVEELKKPI